LAVTDSWRAAIAIYYVLTTYILRRKRHAEAIQLLRAGLSEVLPASLHRVLRQYCKTDGRTDRILTRDNNDVDTCI